MALTVNQMLMLREQDDNPNERKISEIFIDGNLIKGYFTYTFFTEKTYAKEPERSQGGQIDNLNSYATFLTPTLKIEFKAMSMDMYRKIMNLINSKNEFQVSAYDPVADRFVTHNMYFSPAEYPELYIYNLDVLAVLNYTIELIGTNTDLETVSVVYHSNPPAGTGSDVSQGSDSVPYGTEYVIGSDQTISSDAETIPSGYKFKNWNTQPNGGGFTYINDRAYFLTSSLVLYAIWEQSGEFTLSYNYGLGETYTDTNNNNEPLYSKQIVYGDAYGDLPTTAAQKVSYNGAQYTPYTWRGWYRVPRLVDGAVQITATSIYETQGNSTIYQLFSTNSYTITFNSNGGSSVKSITQEYGSTIYEPPAPTKSGATFNGWYATSDFSGNKFDFTTMPPTNVTLYAKWV